jgi:hypothetical protein
MIFLGFFLLTFIQNCPIPIKTGLTITTACTTVQPKFNLTVSFKSVVLVPADRHAASHIDYTYKFNLQRFSILDPFIPCGTLFEESVIEAYVIYEIDNLSDLISLCRQIDVHLFARSDRVYIPRLSWAKAGYNDLSNYSSLLSLTLQNIQLPVDVVFCADMCCNDASHHRAVGLYAEAITRACVPAADSCIPCTKEPHSTHARVPG